jgi:hypothetical protein
MEKKILVYKRVLHHLTISQNLQMLYAIHKDVDTLIVEVPWLRPVFDAFGVELYNLDSLFKQNPKVFETEDIVQKDAERDFTVRSVIAKVQYHYDFAMNDNEKDATRHLMHVVEKYKGAATKDYETETAYLRNMVKELQQTPDLLDYFGIANLVAKLKQENEDFETLYNARAQILHDKQLKGSATKCRASVNKAFDNLCEAITGLLFIPINHEEKTAVNNIIDIINAQIQQATVIYNRHAGVAASKKTDNEKNV